MGDAFYALDGEWRFVYANRRALEFWGTTAAEVIGQVIWQRFPQMVGTLNEQSAAPACVMNSACITFEAPSPTTGIWVSVNVGPSRRRRHGLLARHQRTDRSRARAPQLRREAGARSRGTHPRAERSGGRTAPLARTLQRHLRALAGRSGLHGRRSRMAGSSARTPIPPGNAIPAMPATSSSAGRWRKSCRPSRRNSPPCNTAARSRPGSPSSTNTPRSFPIGEVSRRSFLVPLPGDERAHRACAARPRLT